MKTCDYIRSMLLTDYLDDELDKDAKKSAEEHLINCPGCSQMIAMAREDISVISDKSARKKIPSHVWQSIADKIEKEKHASNAMIDFIRSLAERLTLPRLTPVLVGIILLVLSASFFLYTQRIRQDYGTGNLEYVAGLLTGQESGPAARQEGLGTPIEEYFL